MSKETQLTHLVWREGMTFDATTTTGHHLVLDALPPNGNDRGPKPIELLLTALAGCTAMDVLSILKKMREPVTGLTVDVEGTRAETNPMIYTNIRITYLVRGDVTRSSVERAIGLSRMRYCGVHAMLEQSAHIISRYEIEPNRILEPAASFGPDEVMEIEHIAGSLP